ncbi:MAG: hypothetical protein ACKVVT_08010 [Dehalococcoidia bacterium]
MNKRLVLLSAAGWTLAAGLTAWAVMGPSLVRTASDATSTSRALAENSKFTEAQASALALTAAADYVAMTIGATITEDDGSVSTAVQADGRPIVLDAMTRVDLRFVPRVTKLVTSIDSGFRSHQPVDVWVASWERGAVTSDRVGWEEATAYVVVVIEDGTGKLLSAASGGRAPELQAVAREALPDFDTLFPVNARPRGTAIVLNDGNR